MVELYQDTLIDLLLHKNAKRSKLEIKKDSKVLLEYAGIKIKTNPLYLEFMIFVHAKFGYVSLMYILALLMILFLFFTVREWLLLKM